MKEAMMETLIAVTHILIRGVYIVIMNSHVAAVK